MPYAEVNSIRLYYEVLGHGSPLVMIMGLGANKDWWDPQMLSLLQEEFELVLLDNRGAGRSDKPRGEQTIALMASDVLGLMGHLALDRASLLGVSMGGMIAQEIAATSPHRVEKLILCCTHCGGKESIPPPPEVIELLVSPRGGRSVERIARDSLPLLFPEGYLEAHPEAAKRFIATYCIAPVPAHAFFQQLQAITSWGICERLKEIRSPTLILAGEEDVLVPPENSRILERHIPQAHCIFYPGMGHGFMAQAPGPVARDIIRFLKGGA